MAAAEKRVFLQARFAHAPDQLTADIQQKTASNPIPKSLKAINQEFSNSRPPLLPPAHEQCGGQAHRHAKHSGRDGLNAPPECLATKDRRQHPLQAGT
jgi:hypothetical protein